MVCNLVWFLSLGTELHDALGNLHVDVMAKMAEEERSLRANLESKKEEVRIKQEEVQRSINTLYGSVVATVSLTVPAVLVLGVITNTDVILGLEPFEMVLLALTLILSYPHPRLTGIEGLMKLVIFLFWILLQVA